MKKIVPLIIILFFPYKKANDLSGKIDISVKTNGTANSIDLLQWLLKGENTGFSTTQ